MWLCSFIRCYVQLCMFQFSAAKEKEILPDSVTNVMKHVKSDNSLLLPNGKPLLQDLAAGM